jgi:hypothetical protein
VHPQPPWNIGVRSIGNDANGNMSASPLPITPEQAGSFERTSRTVLTSTASNELVFAIVGHSDSRQASVATKAGRLVSDGSPVALCGIAPGRSRPRYGQATGHEGHSGRAWNRDGVPASGPRRTAEGWRMIEMRRVESGSRRGWTAHSRPCLRRGSMRGCDTVQEFHARVACRARLASGAGCSTRFAQADA